MLVTASPLGSNQMIIIIPVHNLCSDFPWYIPPIHILLRCALNKDQKWTDVTGTVFSILLLWKIVAKKMFSRWLVLTNIYISTTKGDFGFFFLLLCWERTSQKELLTGRISSILPFSFLYLKNKKKRRLLYFKKRRLFFKYYWIINWPHLHPTS